jgi:hypothetical protein
MQDASMSKTEKDKDSTSPAGRIVHDARGNAVWSSTATTSRMLKALDLANLRMEDEAPPEKQPGVKKAGSGYGPGYNPYDRTAPVRATPPKNGKNGSK